MPFKKGESGNLAGRKKGTRNKATMAFKEALLKIDEETGLTQLQVIINKMIEDAKKGDDKARQEILNRAFGKSRELIEVETYNEVIVIDTIDEEADDTDGQEESSLLEVQEEKEN